MGSESSFGDENVWEPDRGGGCVTFNVLNAAGLSILNGLFYVM